MGGRDGSRVSGLSATAYLEQSIREPNAFVVDGFTEGIMCQNYATDLTDQQLSDLVAFLDSLK